MENKKARVIAFYLPQFHPIVENDDWWGKGFTEWTNVGKAKSLFPGHNQPRVPADLGYYDLRLPEVREIQANMAREAGIEGFCYYHYWFAGRRLIEKPFNEVLTSEKPNFPFSLCWANHSWEQKTWSADGKNKMLIEQTYPGIEDHINHFNAVLPAFKDKRYIRVNNKPIFGVYSPKDIPNVSAYIKLWNDLAQKEGFNGVFFVAIIFKSKDIETYTKDGFDAVVFDVMFKRKSLMRFFNLVIHKLFKIPSIIDYRDYSKTLLSEMPVSTDVFPCVLPNYDHTPRSRSKGHLFSNSTPSNWGKLMGGLLEKLKDKKKDENVIFLKSWNEWGEGNYMEPDLKYGNGFLDALHKVLKEDKASK